MTCYKEFLNHIKMVYDMDYRFNRLPDRFWNPLLVYPLMERSRSRFYGRRVFENLCRDSKWHLYRSGKVSRAQDDKELYLTFDCDYEADTEAIPWLLEVLSEQNMVASFAGVGQLMRKDEDTYKLVHESGHELVNHTCTHPNNPVLSPHRKFTDLSEAEMVAEIQHCGKIIEDITGEGPTTFRSPHLRDNMMEFRILDELGYSVCSSASTSNSMLGLPYHPAKSGLGEYSYCMSHIDEDKNFNITMVPIDVCPADKELIFSTWHAIREGKGRHMGVLEFVELWEILLDTSQHKRMVCVYLDPMDLVKDDNTMSEFRYMLGYANHTGWKTRRLDNLEVYP